MSGVAQVIGIKPTLSSFFSKGAFSCAIACNAPIGNTVLSALSALPEPTALKKARRFNSDGNKALTRLASIKLALIDSASSEIRLALLCSSELAC